MADRFRAEVKGDDVLLVIKGKVGPELAVTVPLADTDEIVLALLRATRDLRARGSYLDEVAAISNDLFQAITIYLRAANLQANPIAVPAVVSALLSVSAYMLDTAPSDWRREALAQFNARFAEKTVH